MAEHRRTSPKFWQDPKVRAWRDDLKLLAQYLMTCPNRNTEGLFWLPKAYVSIDLGWPIDRVSKGYSELAEAGFIAFDDPSETVLLIKALKYQRPTGEKQIIGAINTLADVPATPLFSLLRDSAERFAPEFAKALNEALEGGDLADSIPTIDTPSKGYPPSTPSPAPSPAQAQPSGGTPQAATATAVEIVDDEPNAGQLMAEHIDAHPRRPPSQVVGQTAKQVKLLLDEDWSPEDVRAGLALLRSKGLHPSTLPSLVNEAANAPPSAVVRHLPRAMQDEAVFNAGLDRWVEQNT